MTWLLGVQRGGVEINAGCGTAGDAESETGEVTCGTSRKAGLNRLILTVCTGVIKSREKYLSLHLKTLYGPLYGQFRGK